MTEEEAFQFGFMARCVEEGLSPADTALRAEKLAGILDQLGSGAATAGKYTALAPLALAAGVPAAAYGIGSIGGHLAATATSGTPEEYIDQAKHEELQDEYARRIEQIRKLRIARGMTADRKSSGRRVGF